MQGSSKVEKFNSKKSGQNNQDRDLDNRSNLKKKKQDRTAIRDSKRCG